MEITEASKPKSKNPKRVAAGKASAEKRAAQKAELEALRKLEKPEVDPSEITKLCPVDKADKDDKPFKIPEKYEGLAYGFCFGLVGIGAFYYFSKSATEPKKPTIPRTARTVRTAEPYDNPFDY